MCDGCGISMSGMNFTKKFCTLKCGVKYKSEQKYTGNEGIDYLTCPICKIRTRQFTPDHAKMHGYKSIQEMATAHDITQITCSKKKELASGENNQAYQHNGKYSAWSKNFVYGYNKERHMAAKANHSKWVNEHLDQNKFSIEYWLAQTNGNKEEASKLYKKSQTRSIEWFVEKYGEIDGTRRYTLKTERWTKSFKKTNFSLISQELFRSILLELDNTEDIYFATYDRENMSRYVNKEFILQLPHTYVRPDFVCLSRKKVIEFDGTYWHSEVRANPHREKIRDDGIIAVGFEVLHIFESEYKNNKKGTTEKCINFLTQ